MTEIDRARDIVTNFSFKKGDYLGAEKQLCSFADSYARLSVEEAGILRSKFIAKDRLGWFQIASTLFCKRFPEANTLQKDRLCKIFFSLYSFDNLDFGYDSVREVISISEMVKNHKEITQKNWKFFCGLTSNTARDNLENKIFS